MDDLSLALRIRAAVEGQDAIVRLGTSFVDTNKKIETLIRGLTAITGSAEGAGKEFDYLAEKAKQYGISILDMSDNYVKFIAASKETNLEGEAAKKIFESVSAAMAVLGGDTIQTHRAFNSLSQMMSKTQIYAEELKGQLAEAIPGSLQLMAKALNITTGEMLALMEAGQLSADALLPFAYELDQRYGKLATSSVTFAQATNRIETAWALLMKRLGDTGVWSSITSALDTLGKNSEVLAGIIGSGLILSFVKLGQGITSAVAGIKEYALATRLGATASQTSAVAALAAAEAKAQAALAEKVYSQQQLVSATATEVATRGTVAHALALQELQLATAQAAISNKAYAASTASVGVAQNAVVASTGLLSKSWALITGPAGMITLAIAGFAAMALAFKDQDEATQNLSKSTDDYASSLEKMTAAQLANQNITAKEKIDDTKEYIETLQNEIELIDQQASSLSRLTNGWVGFTNVIQFWQEDSEQRNNANLELIKSQEELTVLEGKRQIGLDALSKKYIELTKSEESLKVTNSDLLNDQAKQQQIVNDLNAVWFKSTDQVKQLAKEQEKLNGINKTLVTSSSNLKTANDLTTKALAAYSEQTGLTTEEVKNAIKGDAEFISSLDKKKQATVSAIQRQRELSVLERESQIQLKLLKAEYDNIEGSVKAQTEAKIKEASALGELETKRAAEIDQSRQLVALAELGIKTSKEELNNISLQIAMKQEQSKTNEKERASIEKNIGKLEEQRIGLEKTLNQREANIAAIRAEAIATEAANTTLSQSFAKNQSIISASTEEIARLRREYDEFAKTASGSELLRAQETLSASIQVQQQNIAAAAKQIEVSFKAAFSTLGIDYEEAVSGMDFATQKMISAFGELGVSGKLSASYIQTAFTDLLGQSNTEQELNAIREQLIALQQSGSLSFESLALMTAQVDQKLVELKGSIDPVQLAFEQLGLGVPEKLNQVANSLQASFQIIRDSQAPIEQIRESFLKYAEAQIQASIANNQAIPELVKQQAETFGLSNAYQLLTEKTRQANPEFDALTERFSLLNTAMERNQSQTTATLDAEREWLTVKANLAQALGQEEQQRQLLIDLSQQEVAISQQQIDYQQQKLKNAQDESASLQTTIANGKLLNQEQQQRMEDLKAEIPLLQQQIEGSKAKAAQAQIEADTLRLANTLLSAEFKKQAASAQSMQQVMSEAFKAVGVDQEELVSGMDFQTRRMIDAFGLLGSSANATAQTIQTAFVGLLSKADAEQELEALKNQLITLEDAGRISSEQLAQSLAQISIKAIELKESLDPVGIALDKLGVESADKIQAIAKEFEVLYQTVQKSEAPLETIQQSFIKYAESALQAAAATGNNIDPTLRLEAESLGLVNTFDELQRKTEKQSSEYTALSAKIDRLIQQKQQLRETVQSNISAYASEENAIAKQSAVLGFYGTQVRAVIAANENRLQQAKEEAISQRQAANDIKDKVAQLEKESESLFGLSQAQKEELASLKESSIQKSNSARQAEANYKQLNAEAKSYDAVKSSIEGMIQAQTEDNDRRLELLQLGQGEIAAQQSKIEAINKLIASRELEAQSVQLTMDSINQSIALANEEVAKSDERVVASKNYVNELIAQKTALELQDPLVQKEIENANLVVQGIERQASAARQNALAKEAERLAIQLAAQEAGLSVESYLKVDAALKRLGLNTREVFVGMDAEFEKSLNGLNDFANTAGVTSEDIQRAFTNLFSSANTIEELQALEKEIKALGDNGKLSSDQVVQAIAAIGVKSAEVKGEVDPLSQALDQLGIGNAENLAALADQFRVMYENVKKNKAPIDEIQQGFLKYAESALLAAENGAKIDLAQLQAEASALGLGAAFQELARSLQEVNAEYNAIIAQYERLQTLQDKRNELNQGEIAIREAQSEADQQRSQNLGAEADIIASLVKADQLRLESIQQEIDASEKQVLINTLAIQELEGLESAGIALSKEQKERLALMKLQLQLDQQAILIGKAKQAQIESEIVSYQNSINKIQERLKQYELEAILRTEVNTNEQKTLELQKQLALSQGNLTVAREKDLGVAQEELEIAKEKFLEDAKRLDAINDYILKLEEQYKNEGSNNEQLKVVIETLKLRRAAEIAGTQASEADIKVKERQVELAKLAAGPIVALIQLYKEQAQEHERSAANSERYQDLLVKEAEGVLNLAKIRGDAVEIANEEENVTKARINQAEEISRLRIQEATDSQKALSAKVIEMAADREWTKADQDMENQLRETVDAKIDAANAASKNAEQLRKEADAAKEAAEAQKKLAEEETKAAEAAAQRKAAGDAVNSNFEAANKVLVETGGNMEKLTAAFIRNQEAATRNQVGWTAWAKGTAYAADAVVKAFNNQKDSVDKSVNALNDYVETGKMTVEVQRALQKQTRDARDTFDLLDDVDLDKLQSAIDAANNKLREMQDEAKSAEQRLIELDAEIAAELGDTDRADRIKLELDRTRDLEDAERGLAEARASGNKAAESAYVRQIGKINELYGIKGKNLDKEIKSSKQSITSIKGATDALGQQNDKLSQQQTILEQTKSKVDETTSAWENAKQAVIDANDEFEKIGNQSQYQEELAKAALTLKQDLANAQLDYNQSLSKSSASLKEDLAKTDSDLTKNIAKAVQDSQSKISDLVEKTTEQVADAYKKQNQSIEDAAVKQQDKIEEAIVKTTDAIESEVADHADTIVSIQQDAADSLIKINTDATESLAKLNDSLVKDSMNAMESLQAESDKISGQLRKTKGSVGDDESIAFADESKKIIELYAQAGEQGTEVYNQAMKDARELHRQNIEQLVIEGKLAENVKWNEISKIDAQVKKNEELLKAAQAAVQAEKVAKQQAIEEETQAKIAALNQETESKLATAQLESDKKLESINQQHLATLTNLEIEHQQKLRDIEIELQRSIATANEAQSKLRLSIQSDLAQKLADLKADKDAAIAAAQEKNTAEIVAIQEKLKAEIVAANQKRDAEIANIQAQKEADIQAAREKVKAAVESYNQQNEKLKEVNETLREQSRLLDEISKKGSSNTNPSASLNKGTQDSIVSGHGQTHTVNFNFGGQSLKATSQQDPTNFINALKQAQRSSSV